MELDCFDFLTDMKFPKYITIEQKRLMFQQSLSITQLSGAFIGAAQTCELGMRTNVPSPFESLKSKLFSTNHKLMSSDQRTLIRPAEFRT